LDVTDGESQMLTDLTDDADVFIFLDFTDLGMIAPIVDH
jgi:hypothetical protein